MTVDLSKLREGDRITVRFDAIVTDTNNGLDENPISAEIVRNGDLLFFAREDIVAVERGFQIGDQVKYRDIPSHWTFKIISIFEDRAWLQRIDADRFDSVASLTQITHVGPS